MLNCFITLAGVLCLAFAIYGLADVAPSATPVVALCLWICSGMIFGMAGLLLPGVIFTLAVSVFLFGYTLYKAKNKIKERLFGFFTPGVTAFLIACFAMAVVLQAKQPLFGQWDEFSFWGLSQKIVWQNKMLYTGVKSSLLGVSIPPSLAVLTFLFDFASNAFMEWRCFYAYDVLIFACFALLGIPFEKRNKTFAFSAFAAAFLGLFLLTVTSRGESFSYTYISAMADIPMGVLFGGCLGIYFLNEEKNEKRVFCLLPLVAVLTLIKDMGLALGFIVAFCVFCDMLFDGKNGKFFKFKGFAGAILAALSVAVVTVLFYVLWAKHLAASIDPNAPVSSGDSVSYGGMLIEGVKSLFGLMEPTQKFTDVKSLMISAFFSVPVSLFGGGFMTCLVIFILFFAAFFAAEKKDKKSLAVLYFAMAVGFVGYYIFHLFLYAFIFKDDAYTLASYDRYMGTYYIAWFFAGLCAVGKANKEKKITFALPFAVFVFLRGYFFKTVNPANTFLNYSQNISVARMNTQAKTDKLAHVIAGDDVIYVYSAEESGIVWFVATYTLSDNILIQPTQVDLENPQNSLEKFEKYLKENGVTNLLLDSENSFAGECIRPNADYYPDDMGYDRRAYYRVNYTENGVKYTFIKEI